MTVGISDFLNLPTLQEVLKKDKKEEPSISEEEIEKEIEEQASKSATILHDMSTRLALLEGTDHSEAMDELHQEIVQHARDLMAYGFNTDMRGARGIFEVAGQFYGHAISTKNSQRDAQLKAIKLAMDKKKLDLDEKKTNHIIGNQTQVASISGGNVVVEDRNELIKRLREEMNEK